MNNKFLILSKIRTGSTLLYLALSSHSKIPCHLKSRGEEFSPLIRRKEKTTYFQKRKKIYEDNKINGCKIFYNHLKQNEWEWFKEKKIPIIHLIRRNFIRQHVSKKRLC